MDKERSGGHILTPDTTLGVRPPAISILQIYQDFSDISGVPLSSDRGPAKYRQGINWDYKPYPCADSPSRDIKLHPNNPPI